MPGFNTEDFIAHLSIDCVIFGYKDGELKVLISRFKYGGDLWGLPGGYILKTESTDQAAARILKDRTHLDDIYLEQFRVFGGERRIAYSKHRETIRAALRTYDPDRFDEPTVDWITSRFVCIGYYALVDIGKVHPQAGALETSLEWRNVKELPEMTHDHNEIVAYALQALRQNLDEKLIGFNLLPKTFTMKELMSLYEAVYDREFSMNNFQKKMLDLKVLKRLGKKYTGGQHRAPYLYQFKKK